MRYAFTANCDTCNDHKRVRVTKTGDASCQFCDNDTDDTLFDQVLAHENTAMQELALVQAN